MTTKFASNNYRLIGAGKLTPSEAITPFEVRFVLFDMFGGKLKTLSGTHVARGQRRRRRHNLRVSVVNRGRQDAQGTVITRASSSEWAKRAHGGVFYNTLREH